jgi:hypothetical protein
VSRSKPHWFWSSIITCAAVFLSLVASIMDLIDHITKGRKQGGIMYVPRIRLSAPPVF